MKMNDPLPPMARRGLLTSASALAAAPMPAAAAASGLNFKDIPHGTGETHAIAPDHTAQVLLRWGDPVTADAPAWNPTAQSGRAQQRQFGTECDFTAFMPLPYGSASSTTGLLCVNHESLDARMIFPGVATRENPDEPRDRVDIEMAAHGLSIVEIAYEKGRWQPKVGGRFNRRITAKDTVMALTGPAAGSARLRTADDPTGRAVIGTLGNCSGGVTPWGTVLSGEENIHHYFGGDPRGTAEEANHLGMGITTELYYGWHKHLPRFDVARELHEPNRFGWVIEIDPYDPDVPIKKRTALGRFKHEGAGTAMDRSGRVVIYSGDDEVFQFVYRFVSAQPFHPGDRAKNADILDAGQLSVARFNADGTVDWLPLVWGTGALTAANGFNGQADVLIDCRRAAKLLGATPMDRPEGVVADPVLGRVFGSLTKNSKRTAGQIDAANPRANNRHGHILELMPPSESGAAPDHAAPTFRWRTFLMAGDPANPAAGAQYNADISASGWLSCPDNLAFDPLGRLWITTDGAEDHGIGDGIWATEIEGPARALTRHLFRGPHGSELTGPSFSPDGTTLFASVQHPAEGSSFAKPSTRWPDFDPELPPRSSVVAIRRADGRPVG